jgi:hypothetical protein
VKVNSNRNINLLTGSEQLNLEIKEAITPEFTMPDAEKNGDKRNTYQYVKSFLCIEKARIDSIGTNPHYRITCWWPRISTKGKVTIQENNLSVIKDVYVYKTTGLYAVKKSIERYSNNDNALL